MAKKKGKKGGRKKGMPSVANIMLTMNALNELGLLSVMADAVGPDRNIVDSLTDWGAGADPMALIDAVIPFLIIRMMRKFTGPIRAGPINIL